VSETTPFRNTAEDLIRLWETWVEDVQEDSYRAQIPPLLELQTICRETGCALPELDSFARLKDRPPAFLFCGNDEILAADVAAVFGYEVQFPGIPEEKVIWWVENGESAEIRLIHGTVEKEVSRSTLAALLEHKLPGNETLVIEEREPTPSRWRFVWLPNAHHCRIPDGIRCENDILLAQRAALVIREGTPEPLREALDELGQKLWLVSKDDLSLPADRKKLLEEIATLPNERQQELELRLSATWRWLCIRLIEQISEKRRLYKQALSRFEVGRASARHLLEQYKRNWTGGIRTLTQTHLQNRVAGAAFASLLDAQKPGPQPDTFLAVIALPSLWVKVDEYLTDQMANLLAGLSGLAAKLELHRIGLGEANTHWSCRALGPLLERQLKEKKLFPADSGKRGGLVGNLTGRKQALIEDRKSQISRGSRLVMQTIETEFVNWCGSFISNVEAGITLQLTASLVNREYPDPEGLQTALEGLDRLETAIQRRRESARSPEAIAAELLNTMTQRRWIPLYQPR